jgi:HAD superfamily hydrolase (TIGR01509 family)
MVTQVPQPGLAPLMQYLDARGTPKGICTRNFDAPVVHLLTKFLPGSRFEPVITREFEPPKPHPAGVLECARRWEVQGADVVMVGDSSDDMVAGRRAGAMTVLLVGGGNEAVREREETDAWVRSLAELWERLAAGLESGGAEL